MSLKLREIKSGEEKNLAKLLKECFSKEYPSFIKFDEEYVRKKIENERNNIFIALEKDNIVGSIRAKKTGDDLAELVQISVTKKFRNKGIGTKLMKKTVQELKKKGIRKITATSNSKDKKGMIFLIQNNFEPETIMKQHYNTKNDVVQFSLFVK